LRQSWSGCASEAAGHRRSPGPENRVHAETRREKAGLFDGRDRKERQKGNKNDGDLNRKMREILENWGDGEISHEGAKTRREKRESEFRPDLPAEQERETNKKADVL
jgi:hypothetical protein